MKGIAWKFPNGLVPYGDARNFLFSRQISVLPNFSKIEYFDMLTLLCDVKNAVNSRPLTYLLNRI